MLPANHGDCILIEWGAKQSPRRILVDGGPTYAWKRLGGLFGKTALNFDLVVITHIDFDHIGGVLQFLAKPPAGVSVDQVWFNAYQHLPESDELGAPQAEVLTDVINRRKLPWNRSFKGR